MQVLYVSMACAVDLTFEGVSFAVEDDVGGAQAATTSVIVDGGGL